MTYAVIYDSWDGNDDDWRDDMYEPFDTPEQAEKMFLDMVGDDPESYRNPRVVLILHRIQPPALTSGWGV